MIPGLLGLWSLTSKLTESHEGLCIVMVVSCMCDRHTDDQDWEEGSSGLDGGEKRALDCGYSAILFDVSTLALFRR